MRLKDMKIGRKIILGFSMVSLVTFFVGVIGYSGISWVAKSFDDVAIVRMPSIRYLDEIQQGFEIVRSSHRTLLNPNLRPEAIARQYHNIASGRKQYVEAIEQFEGLGQNQEIMDVWRQFL
ncbi:MAG: MCP four helix bundle domain-containing protein [Salinivirgaceae bacterium]|nr:MCP four helix bundle domain-containing protein [Salinivirgaceae bacterium]